MSSGTVRFLADSEYALETPAGSLRACRAAGCLLDPGPGDVVLFWESAFGTAYILCVLEKAPARESVISIEGDLSVRARGGSINMSADAVGLSGGEKVSLNSPELEITAAQARVSVGSMGFTGKILTAACDKVRLTALAFDSVVDRMTQTLRSSFRRISDVEHVHAGRIRSVVSDAWSLLSRKTDIKAKEKVKIAGERVDLG